MLHFYTLCVVPIQFSEAISRLVPSAKVIDSVNATLEMIEDDWWS